MVFAGKYALVTGSSRGIGRGIALKLAEQGARVAIHYYQNEAAAQDTLQKVREKGSDGFLLQADICQMRQVESLFERVRNEFGRLDIFVSNARTEAPTFYQPPLDLTLQAWDTAVDSQAKAFLVAVRAALPLMRDGGRIIGITYAPGGRYGSWQPWVAMGAAKAALEVLVRYLAVALAPRQITVNSISPGWIEDSVLNSLPPAVQHTIRGWHESGGTPMGRLGTPADIGNAVSLFCSPEAGWITGQLLDVDGGASLMDSHLPLDPAGGAQAGSCGLRVRQRGVSAAPLGRLLAERGAGFLRQVGDGALTARRRRGFLDIAARGRSLSFAGHGSSYLWRLKNWTARSWRFAFSSELKVPRFLRRPLRASFLREYRRYSPDFNLRIMGWGCAASRQRCPQVERSRPIRQAGIQWARSPARR